MWQCCEPSFVPLEPNFTNGECCKHRDHIPRKPMSTERNVESFLLKPRLKTMAVIQKIATKQENSLTNKEIG